MFTYFTTYMSGVIRVPFAQVEHEPAVLRAVGGEVGGLGGGGGLDVHGLVRFVARLDVKARRRRQ